MEGIESQWQTVFGASAKLGRYSTLSKTSKKAIPIVILDIFFKNTVLMTAVSVVGILVVSSSFVQTSFPFVLSIPTKIFDTLSLTVKAVLYVNYLTDLDVFPISVKGAMAIPAMPFLS